MKFIKLLPVIFLLLEACVDPLKVNLLSIRDQLVVDGSITDQPGPYTVKIFYSSTLDKTLRKPEAETNAAIWIISDNNESEKLNLIDLGSYQTNPDGIKGQIGTSYKLRIVTDNGEYETKFQKLSPSGSLDSVFVKFEPKALTNNGNSELKDALNLMVNAKGIKSGSNLYRWRFKNVYKVKTFPELRTQNIRGVLFPDPEPCSGYVANGKNISKRSECTCCICWSTEYSDAVVLSNNDFVQDYKYSNVSLGKLLISSLRFYDRIYVEVEQLSLSEDTYEFWNLVEKQEKATGNLFQPNAIRIHGNIYSISDPAEEVLGIFAVSSVENKSIFIDKSVLPYTLPPIDTIGYDCRYTFLNSTTEKPPFW